MKKIFSVLIFNLLFFNALFAQSYWRTECCMIWETECGSKWEAVGGQDDCAESPPLSIRIFPNPTDGILNIETENISNIEYAIYDAQGKKVLTASSSEIDISHLPATIYFLVYQNKILKFLKL